MYTNTKLTGFTQNIINQVYDANNEPYDKESMIQLTNEAIESNYSIIHAYEAAEIVASAISEGDRDEFMQSPSGADILLATKNEGAGTYGFHIGGENLGYAQGIEVFTAWTILAAMLAEWKASELDYTPSKHAN